MPFPTADPLTTKTHPDPNILLGSYSNQQCDEQKLIVKENRTELDAAFFSPSATNNVSEVMALPCSPFRIQIMVITADKVHNQPPLSLMAVVSKQLSTFVAGITEEQVSIHLTG